MPSGDAGNSLECARKHMERVQSAWEDPVDWLDLSIYGFYCLEAAVVAAALHVGIKIKRSHPGKVEAAKQLALSHNLPDVSDFIWELNSARKSKAYGDVDFPDLNAEDVAARIEHFLDAVSSLLET